MWCLYNPTPSGRCKMDAHSMDFGKESAWVYFNFPFTIKLAIGLNVFSQDLSPLGRISLPVSLLNSFHHEELLNSALIEDLTLYDNKFWNDPRDFAKLVKAISLPQDVLSTSDRHLIELENHVQRLMEAHLAPNPPVQVNKIASSYGTKSYPIGIIKNVEVHKGKLKLLEDLYVIDMKKDPTTPLLVGRGFLATASAIIDCQKAKIAVREGVTSADGIGGRPPYYDKKDFMDYNFLKEWEIARDVELNPFKDVLVFRKMVEFLGAIPINLKRNMWESKELIEKRIDWNRTLKEGDGAWHIRSELINPNGEKFNKTF
uniref:MAK10-like protein n=1 Tax=Tanacetum cinerariifolium TaxID=118510 RepID=A0A6L2JCS8_TANCI|nr:MAK10-like protein [Tanacetum cinerariifolium]